MKISEKNNMFNFIKIINFFLKYNIYINNLK